MKSLVGGSRSHTVWSALVLALSTIFSTTSSAVFIAPGGDGPGTSLQDVFDSITVTPTTGSSIDVQGDQLSDSQDSLWSITATGGSVATLVIEIAGFANRNSLGVYDAANSANRVTLFGGSASAGSQTILSILADGSVNVNFADTGTNFAANSFGYYLKTPNGMFFSDTALNTDGVDHMVAYQGKDSDTIQVGPFAPGLWTDREFALAWEDLYGGGDRDYQDFVVLVESVVPAVPTPVPAAVWLFGSGLIGLAGIARHRKPS